jgi:hypothetical protein
MLARADERPLQGAGQSVGIQREKEATAATVTTRCMTILLSSPARALADLVTT